MVITAWYCLVSNVRVPYDLLVKITLESIKYLSSIYYLCVILRLDPSVDGDNNPPIPKTIKNQGDRIGPQKIL